MVLSESPRVAGELSQLNSTGMHFAPQGGAVLPKGEESVEHHARHIHVRVRRLDCAGHLDRDILGVAAPLGEKQELRVV